MFSDILGAGLFGAIERGAKAGEFNKVTDELIKLNAEIAALDKELKADLLQNAMENSASQQAIRDADTANLMETKIQEARLTKVS